MKKIFQLIKDFIFNTDTRDKQLILTAIEITNAIKNFEENPLVDSIVAITKNQVDDWMLRVLRVYIPKILYRLNMCLISDSIGHTSIKVASLRLKNMEKPFRGDMLDAIACNIVPIVSKNKISWGTAKKVVKQIYDENKLKNSSK